MMKKRMGSKERLKNWYDPFKSPPSYEKAKQHRKAWQVGVSKRGRVKRCECCMYPLDKQSFDLRCSHAQLAPLGTSLAFYFQAIQLTVTLLLSQLLLALLGLAIFSCLPPLAFSPETLVSLALSTSSLGYWLIALWLFSMLTILLARKYSNRQLYNFQSQNPTQSSFALQLSNLPTCQQYEIKKWVVSHCGSQPLYVQIAYDIREWNQAFAKRQELTIYKNKLLQEQVDQDQSQDIAQSSAFINLISNSKKKDMGEVQTQIKKADQSLNKYRIHSSLSQQKQIGMAFVVFDSVKIVKDFLAKMRRKKDNRLSFKQKIVIVEKAPNPRDIVWENLPVYNKRNSRTISILAICVGVSLLVFMGLYLRSASKLYQIFQHNGFAYIIVLLAYGAYHLGTHFLVQLEMKLNRCQTNTAEKIVAFRAYSLLNIFLGTSLPYFLNTHSRNLVLLVNFTLFVDAFSHPLIKAFNLSHISKKLMGEYIKKMQTSKNFYTQDYLNRLLEGTRFKLGQNYHYVFRALFLSSYYAYAAPLGFFYYSISIIIEAIVQKYLLCRVCKMPAKYSSKLAETFVDSLSIIPGSLILGTLLFELFGQQKTMEDVWPRIVLLFLSICFIWFYTIFLRQRTQQFEEDQSYYSIKQKLTECYKWSNPIKRFNGELFTRFLASRQREVSSPPELELQDKSSRSNQRQRETIESARNKMITRMSLANDLYDIHVNEDYKRMNDA